MSGDWAAAQAAGVAVLDPAGWSDDGDAYTLAGVSRPPPAGRPELTTLVPNTMVVGGPDVTLHCQGTGFVRACRIVFAGRPERTDFTDDTDVSTHITSALWGAPDTVQVQVFDPARGASAALPFTFTAAAGDPEEQVPEGTITDVLAWVGSDPKRARRALSAEQAGQNRSTLITALQAI